MRLRGEEKMERMVGLYVVYRLEHTIMAGSWILYFPRQAGCYGMLHNKDADIITAQNYIAC